MDMWRSGDHVKLIINAVVPTYKLPEPIQAAGGYFLPHRRVDDPTHQQHMVCLAKLRQLLKSRVVSKEWHEVRRDLILAGGYFMPRRRAFDPTHQQDMVTWQDTMRQLLKSRAVSKEWQKVSFQITREHMWAFCVYIPRVMYCALHMLVDLKTLKENKTIETEQNIT